MRTIALLLALTSTVPALAADTPPAVTETFRLKAEEAHQGVVADARHIYAISNAEIGKYDRKTGQRVAQWHGDPKLFRHMNSCILEARMLVCAASNYPEVPQASSIEWFDTVKMAHVKTRSLGPQRGSLTWLDWHDGSWWAGFANYDNKGGEPGRDHKLTTLVRYTPDFTELDAWLFPATVLDRFAPFSTSGGAWGQDGLLYVTGHDRPELYAVRLPEAGSTLQHVATIGLTTNGQAIAWEKGGAPRTLWSISRAGSEVVAATVPPVTPEVKP